MSIVSCGDDVDGIAAAVLLDGRLTGRDGRRGSSISDYVLFSGTDDGAMAR
jgi:hypothetical protein